MNRASLSALPANAMGATMNDTSGQLFETPLACYDRVTSCWRMFAGTSPSDSTGCWLTLPASGLMRNGQLFEAPMSGRRTDGNGSSSLLATPTAWLGRRPSHSDATLEAARAPGPNQGRELVRDVASLLPTPTSRDHKDGTVETEYRNRQTGSLDSIPKLLPTPTVQMDKPSTTTGAPVADNYTPGDSLIDAVRITTGQATGLERGAATGQPSTGGNGSPEPEHQTLWTTGDD